MTGSRRSLGWSVAPPKDPRLDVPIAVLLYRAFTIAIGLVIVGLGFLLFAKSDTKDTTPPETEEEELEASNANAVVRLRGAAGIFFVFLGAIVILGAIFKTFDLQIADTPSRTETMEQPVPGKSDEPPARPSRPANNPPLTGTGGGGGGASGGWSPGQWGGSSRGTAGKWIPQEDTIVRHDGGDSTSE